MIAACWIVAAALPRLAQAQSLDGSRAAVLRAYKIANDLKLPFLETREQIKQHLKAGELVKVVPSGDLALHQVSYPFTVPQVSRFLRKLAVRYRRACGEQLVVTSLVRPKNEQPRNASSRSVHPTGLAADLRRSKSEACRTWLERTLLEEEAKGVIEATRERHPPHYHVVVLPRPQPTAAKAREASGEAPATKTKGTPTPAKAQLAKSRGPATERGGRDSKLATETYQVRPKESLWQIARQQGTTVETLKALNALEGLQIRAGQTLTVPRKNERPSE